MRDNRKGVSRRPVILAVDDDPNTLAKLSVELQRRYERDYRVLYEGSAPAALAQLEEMRDTGDRVAVVLADQWMPDLTGAELLARVSDLHPHAKRALLIAWADWADGPTADAVRSAMALGHIDYYVLKPWKSPDELFHRTMGEFLHEWARVDESAPREVTVVADSWSPRGHELRNLLARNGVPHVFHPSDSAEGRRLLREADREGSSEPIVFLLDGEVLVDPSNDELARGYGVATELVGPCDFDVVVVGAGPAGLAAAVYTHPQLSRVLAWCDRRRAGSAGLPAGLGVRDAVPSHARRDRLAQRRRRSRGHRLRRHRDPHPQRRPRYGRHLLPARDPRTRAAQR
jgi:thioredoxin reductase (NADPH)